MNSRQQLLRFLFENSDNPGFIEAKEVIKTLDISKHELNKLISFLEQDNLIKGDGNHHEYFTTKQGKSPTIDEVSFKLRLTPAGRNEVLSEQQNIPSKSSEAINEPIIEQNLAFIIMQIGNPALDKIYNEVYKPVLLQMGLNPKRIDQDNEGTLLKNEITENIKKANIIIADLTNERPNCYLEVGYAMGLNKYTNLILTASEDHNFDSENHKKGGPKIHFDISGYDIFFYNKSRFDEYKDALIAKVSNRLKLLSQQKNETGIVRESKSDWDFEWLELQRKYCNDKRNEIGFIGTLEVLISPVGTNLNLSSIEISKVADKSQIQETGWPFAIVLNNNPRWKPKSKIDGLLSEVSDNNDGYFGRVFDYTYFKRNGQIFSTTGIRQDNIDASLFSINDTICLIAEILLYLERYYAYCGLRKETVISVKLIFNGLAGRALTYGQRPMATKKQIDENSCALQIETSLLDIHENVAAITVKIVSPLFELFELFELKEEYIVSKVYEFRQFLLQKKI